MLRPLLVASCLNAPLVGAEAHAEGIGDVLTQPLRDLSILRRQTPEVLQRAGEVPYAEPPTLASGALDCASVTTEIEALEAALGQDTSGVTPPASLMAQARMEASNAVVDAIGDVVELPYRSVIRRLTGAHRRDREARQAVQAGMVRRAFLRGLSARECSTPQLQAAFEPAPFVPLSDLELARTHLAAANAAAAERTLVTLAAAAPDDVLMVAAAEPQLPDLEPARTQPAAAHTPATPQSELWTPIAASSSARMSDLELARTQLAAAHAETAADLWRPASEVAPTTATAPLSDLELARMQLAEANAAAATRLARSANF